MPKRAPSPPPPDDEPRYFTVVHPYPRHANFEVEEEHIKFARWIAACIGTKPLLALHHKPSARDMVLIETNRDWNEHHLLLGQHSYDKFLKNPSDYEKGLTSEIFFSTYSTGRDAQKDGWKKIYVKDSWFKDWNPGDTFINSPYPASIRCELPIEDRTNKPLCRPIPERIKPPTAKPPRIVVGSDAYASSKNGSASESARGKTSSKGNARGGPALNVSTRSTNVSQGKGGSKPASAVTPASARAVAWDKPIQINKSASSPASTSAPAPASTPRGAWGASPPPVAAASSAPPRNAWNTSKSKPTSTPMPTQPLGIPIPRSSASFTSPAYPPGIARPANAPSTPPGLVHPSQNRSPNVAISVSSGSSSSSFDWAADVDAAEAAYANDYSPCDFIEGGLKNVKIASESSMEDELLGVSGDFEEPDGPENFVAEWEKNLAPTSVSVVEPAVPVAANDNGDSVENPWADWDKGTEVVDFLCPTHGKLCKKGICKDAAKAKHEQKKKERAGQRSQRAAGNTDRRTRGQGNSEAGWRSNTSDRTWRYNNGRSSGSSSNGGSRSVSRASGRDQISREPPQASEAVELADDDAEPWD